MAGGAPGTKIKRPVSKPFVVAAVAFVFAGSSIGSVWFLMLLGARLPVDLLSFSLHRVLQMDGFLTMLVMGIGYMIVPRFRNTDLPSKWVAYASFVMVFASVAASIASALLGSDGAVQVVADVLRLAGTSIFAVIILWMLRVRPRLLRLADYFIALSVITLVAVNVLAIGTYSSINPLIEIQMWMLFPTLMIFGIEYKTMPSFLGFIRPRKRLARASLVLAVAAVGFGISSLLQDSAVFPLAFNASLFSSAFLLATSLFFYGGFDNSEIMRYLSGEKKARYLYTAAYSWLAFALLYAGCTFAILFYSVAGDWAFLFYDLAIHYTAIGFVGATVALYLPLMLPPILGKPVNFARFNHAPILLLLSALVLRGAGDIFIGRAAGPVSYILMASGWLVVAALFVFVRMLHRSMSVQETAATASNNADPKRG